MSKQEHGLVPALRFPEFKGSGEWKDETLGNCLLKHPEYGIGAAAVPFSKKLPIYLRITDISEEGIFLKKNLVSVDKNVTKENYLEEGDLVFARTGASVGKSYKYRIKDGRLVFAGFLIRVTPNINLLDSELLFQYTSSEKYWSWVKFISARSGQPGINGNEYATMPITLPKTIEEQQKIASCLLSLDEVINGHSQKLEALKEHKKGLMQNLFPADGESVPKVRFKEFENDGEWVENSIQKLIDEKIIISHLDGNHGSLYPSAEEFSSTGIPYITANDFITGEVSFMNCKYLPLERAKQFKKGIAKNGDILFAHNATVGPVAKLITDFEYVILSTTATYFRCDNILLNNDFLKYAMISLKFVKQYTRVMSQSTRNQVPITTQRLFILQIPKIKEQEEIAKCLTTIDEQIQAQTQKIEQLKMHKKGLMQGMFPKSITN